MKVIEAICKAAVKVRNGLPHGEHYLDPGSPRRFRMTADLIHSTYSTMSVGVQLPGVTDPLGYDSLPVEIGALLQQRLWRSSAARR